jgi:hypothetical protein
MDVEFMATDSLEAIRPKLALLKNIEDAATAVDEMFASTVQGTGCGYPSLWIYTILIPSQPALVKAAVMIAAMRVNALPKTRTRTGTRTIPALLTLS